MKPANLQTKIFLDGGDPKETKEIIDLLGFLDGQTTNPTLIAKNPQAQQRLQSGEKFSSREIFDFYRTVVGELSTLLPQGSISIEVYADSHTSTAEMVSQAIEMFGWIPNAHIKLPLTTAGLAAAEQLIKEKMRINITLCFSQEQAAAVHAATKDAVKGQVFVSPFVGRLDDQQENGMQLIANIIKMYSASDKHVEVLSASIRNLDHFLYSLQLGADIITTPAKILKEWAAAGFPIPNTDYLYPVGDLKDIAYQNLDLTKDWRDFDINHSLTAKGIERFAQDWNALIK